MTQASALRRQIETALQDRVPGALTPRPVGVRETIPCGIDAMDALMRGGFPIGALAELVGPECSGRTTAALSFLSRVTAEGNVCAWIDVSDAFDPETANASGIDLDRMLWVRCSAGSSRPAPPQPEQVKAIATPPQHDSRVVLASGGGSPHPRSEGRGMSEAIQQLLQGQPRSAAIKDLRLNRGIGTPGAPNRPVSGRHAQGEREEQVPTDRLPPRRGENLQTASSQHSSSVQMKASLAASMAEKSMEIPSPAKVPHEGKQRWSALDRALRTADLLLQGGGFRAIVFDLGSTPADIAWRVPISTWFRFRAACERSRVSFLLLTQHPCARSSAELVVRMQPGEFQHMGAVMTCIAYRGELDRQRQHRPESNVVSIRKESRSDTCAQWSARATWARA